MRKYKHDDKKTTAALQAALSARLLHLFLHVFFLAISLSLPKALEEGISELIFGSLLIIVFVLPRSVPVARWSSAAPVVQEFLVVLLLSSAPRSCLELLEPEVLSAAHRPSEGH